ncbi:MAG: hypothetical protein ABSB79_09760 [Syntrophales bacterium]|jgi:hypothetical protein
MRERIKVLLSQIPLFLLSVVIFSIAAVLGWEKLHYGFNFFDEGLFMTEAWRLTVGDHYFQDKFTGALNLSPFISSIFFRISPNITLLGFRKLQFLFTILSSILLSIALYQTNRIYWYQLFVFSLFAFTGFNLTGGIPNLFYHTYPHLFITLHLAALLFGLYQQSVAIRRMLFLLSGFFLWCISFNLLHLSLVLASPMILFLFFRILKQNDEKFGFIDLFFIYLPIVICWGTFIAIFNRAYFQNILDTIQLMKISKLYKYKNLIHVNWGVLARVFITFVYLLICVLSILKLRLIPLAIALILLSSSMFIIIKTSFFGLIPLPDWLFFFDKPMWLAGLLLSFLMIFTFYMLWTLYRKQEFSKEETIAVILAIPCMILSVSSITFSFNGALNVLDYSIPLVGAMSILILSHKKKAPSHYLVQFLILLMLFAPFYSSTARFNWLFTCFDVAPKDANAEINDGFCRGIKTNTVYKNLYVWLETMADKYTQKDDFIISYTCTAMVHMITKRRPALDESAIDFWIYPPEYYEAAINKMKNGKREPAMAFVFETTPAFLSPDLEGGNYYYMYMKLIHIPSNDPVTKYIAGNMRPVDEFRTADGVNVRCYIRK